MTSGMNALLTTTAQEAKMTGILVGLLRSMMCGKAAKLNEDGEVRSLTNAQVLKRWSMVDVSLEMQIRRLKWYQSMSRTPREQEQFLVTWFCQVEFEKSTGDHPWRQQFYKDIEMLEHINEVAWLCEEIVSDPLCISKETEVNMQLIFRELTLNI